ncbi:MAG: aldo/keto reductase [Clostridia bacterium]|nr:aldo/keto reductase [Clostridia bacterium]MBO7170158.1 aldo/keto reductase [Clostridia bacterium]
MRYTERNGQTLSKFQLGTVQLGMTYGLGEDREKPSEEKAMALLDRAAALGVNNLDTANNYGDSERVVGKWLQKRKAEGEPTPWVVTKIGPLAHGSYDALRDDALRQTETCLKTLGVDRIDCLMVHNFEDYESDPDAMRKIFEEMKREGLYQTSALSAYSRHDYKTIAASGFDAVQIPLNVFDWGQIENGGMAALADSGMTVFARSVFLQGLVFHTPEDLDPRMSFCAPYLERYLALCREFKLAPDVLALSYVLSVPGVSCAVLGCDNVSQLEANCRLIDSTVSLTEEQIAKLRAAFVDIDPRVINPGVWFNHT